MLITADGGRILDFEQLMRLHETRVLRIAWRITGNLADAQDVAQEAFLRLHKNIKAFSEPEMVLPWLRRVTVNLCIDQKRRPATVPLDGLTLVHNRPDPERAAALREAADHLQQALAELGERERAALVLHDLEGLSSAEAAEVLGTTESTIRVQTSRARLKLRRLLQGANA